jgi:uncharacterized protein YndB with AHSA1/START domain
MLSINASAPAITRASVTIDAPADVVFAILSDVADWPSWQKSVSSVEVDGTVGLGTRFRWKSGGSRIVSTIELFEPPHAIGWRGRTLGIRAVHIWRFTPVGSATGVETEESFEGWLASALAPVMRRVLRQIVAAAVADLKREAERREAKKTRDPGP